MMSAAELDGRLRSIDKGVGEAFDSALAEADEGEVAAATVRALEGVALELRALRLAVLAPRPRQTVKWWW